jgi:response regulator RpfG family c-di-GMP phosphodiesterase
VTREIVILTFFSVFSAIVETHDVDRAVSAAGLSDYIAKPVGIKELSALIIKELEASGSL